MDGFFANNPLGEDPDDESMLGDNAMGVARGASFLMGDDPNKDSVKPVASSPIGDAPMGEKPKENPFGDDPLGLLSGVNPLGGNIKPDTSFGGGTNVAKPSALGPNPLGDDPLGLLSGINPLGGNIKPDTSFGGGTTIGRPSSLGPNPLGPNPLGLNPLGENPLGPDPLGLGAKEEAAPAPAPEPIPVPEPAPEPEEPKEVPLGGIISLEDDFGDGVLGGIISLSDPSSFSSGVFSSGSSFGSGVISSGSSYDDEAASGESSGEASDGSSLGSGVVSGSYSYDDDDNSIQIPYGDGTLDSTLEGSSSYYNNGSSLADDDDYKPLGENVNDDVFSLNYAGLDSADDDPLGLMSGGAPVNNQMGDVPTAPKINDAEGMDPLRALLLAGGNPFGDNAKKIAPDLSFGKEALKPKHFEPMKASGPRVQAENVRVNKPLGDNPFGKDIAPDISFGKESLKLKKYVPKKPFEETGTLANEMLAGSNQGDESEEQPLAVDGQEVYDFEGKAAENVSILEKDTRELHFEEENMLGYNAMGVDRSASFLMGADPNEVVQKAVEDFTLGDAPMGVAPKVAPEMKAPAPQPQQQSPVKVTPLGENALSANPLGENVKPDVSFDDATTVASASGLGPNPLGPDPLGLLAAENKKNENAFEEKTTVKPAVSEPETKKSWGENPLGPNPLGLNPLGMNIRPDTSFGGGAAVRPVGSYGSDTLIKPAQPAESETLIKPASSYGEETLIKPASPYGSDTLVKPAAKPVNLYEDLEPAKPAPVSSFAAAHSTTSSLYDDLDEPNEEEEEEEDSDERFCPECGMPMVGRDSFCNRCGKKVEPVGKREYERMRAKKSGGSTTSRSSAGSSSRNTTGSGFRGNTGGNGGSYGGNGGSYGGNGGFGGYDDDEYGRAPIPTSRVRQAPEIPVKLIVLGAVTAVMVIVAIVCTVLAISASKKDAITVLRKDSVTNGHNVTETITFFSTGNKIRSIKEEMVIDATGMSQDDINFNKEHWDKTYADIAKASFIDYSVSQDGNEIVMHLTYNFLDNKDNITTMSELGLFKLGGNKTEAGNGDYIALKKTLKDLQKTGYVLQENK